MFSVEKKLDKSEGHTNNVNICLNVNNAFYFET